MSARKHDIITYCTTCRWPTDSLLLKSIAAHITLTTTHSLDWTLRMENAENENKMYRKSTRLALSNKSELPSIKYSVLNAVHMKWAMVLYSGSFGL